MAQLRSGLGGPPMYKTESAGLFSQTSSTASEMASLSDCNEKSLKLAVVASTVGVGYHLTELYTKNLLQDLNFSMKSTKVSKVAYGGF